MTVSDVRPSRGSGALRCDLGVTLVELLAAIAIGVLVLLAASSLLSSARAGERVLNDVVEPAGALELAAELLREEVALAGFVPWTLEGGGVDTAPPQSVAPVPLTVSGAATSSHEVALAYVDDRLASGPVARALSYSVDRDSRGALQLYRRSGSSARQPLVEGVERLEVTGYVDALGLHALPAVGADSLSLQGVWAVELRLTAASGLARPLLVPLPSRPGVLVRP